MEVLLLTDLSSFFFFSCSQLGTAGCIYFILGLGKFYGPEADWHPIPQVHKAYIQNRVGFCTCDRWLKLCQNSTREVTTFNLTVPYCLGFY